MTDVSRELQNDDVRAAANSFLQWAKDNHLLSRSGVEEGADYVDEDLPVEKEAFFSSQKVQDVFRRKAINLIGFNEAARKVIVFTHNRIGVSDRKILPISTENGVQIEYIQGGVPYVKGATPPPEPHLPYTEHQGRYCCGSSIFPANCIGAGTLGLLAVDGSGDIYGVSNNHVCGACNHAQPGLPILAPGPADVSGDNMAPFSIGRHVRLLPINDGIPENIDVSVNLDAACFRVSNVDAVSSMQGTQYDTPAIVAEPSAGMFVEKVGRTTGHTVGSIVAQAASPISVSYAVNEYGVRKSVFFSTAFIIQSVLPPFSKRGDSGSLVVHRASDGSRQAVGLVFAGDDKGLSFMLPLPAILNGLGLSILANHGV